MAELVPGRKPCTHCGKCCKKEVCPFGEIFMRTTKPPCPALVKDKEGKYWCGLATNPEKTMYAKTKWAKFWAKELSKALEEAFKFGAGCDY